MSSEVQGDHGPLFMDRRKAPHTRTERMDRVFRTYRFLQSAAESRLDVPSARSAWSKAVVNTAKSTLRGTTK